LLEVLTREEKMKYLINFLKGLAIGVATLVPGVSGGTMAIVLGVYDDLIHAISSFFQDWKKNIVILLEVGLGGLAGLLLFSKLFLNVLDRYPVVMGFFFMGVIFGGLPVLFKKATAAGKVKLKDMIFFVIGFIVVLLLSAEPEKTTAMAADPSFTSIVFLFIAGVVLAVALILPGISGSFMLLVLGLLDVTLNAIDTRNIPFLVPLGLGVALGTLGTAKTIEKLMQKHPSKTYMLILGFVLGSLLPVFPGKPVGLSIVSSAIALIAGFILINWLSKKEI
jgi:putative membrane protein